MCSCSASLFVPLVFFLGWNLHVASTQPDKRHVIAQAEFLGNESIVDLDDRGFSKREELKSCYETKKIPDLIKDLPVFLGKGFFLMRLPKQVKPPVIFGFQPKTCPGDSYKHFPNTPLNLRSACPFSYYRHDLGNNMFPRYIVEAVCVCYYCMTTYHNNCHGIWESFEILKVISCKHGLALVERRIINIVRACACVRAGPRVIVNGTDFVETE